jgi:hypothetical protein
LNQSFSKAEFPLCSVVENNKSGSLGGRSKTNRNLWGKLKGCPPDDSGGIESEGENESKSKIIESPHIYLREVDVKIVRPFREQILNGRSEDKVSIPFAWQHLYRPERGHPVVLWHLRDGGQVAVIHAVQKTCNLQIRTSFTTGGTG